MMMQVVHKNIANGDMFQVNGMNLDITALLSKENIDWNTVKEGFNVAPAKFEELLFRVHYKRKKPLTAAERSRVVNFLSIGYLATDDIRYFNEFLWFYTTAADKDLHTTCMERFYANLDEKGMHKFPKQLAHYTVDTDMVTTPKDKNPLRIALVGFPPFFGKIIKQLKEEGHHVEQFFLPYHPNKKVNAVLKFKLPVKLLSLLSGNKYPYQTLNYEPKDERIGQVLKQGNFDIGFHKLNFIIRSNIFSSFKKGLLNDHWGYLPMLRGKSTIAYSLLLNVPLVSTIHFIEKGIDSGAIAGYYPCDYSMATNLEEIRKIVKQHMPERVIAAIQLAGSNDFIPKENKQAAGLTFYEMHEWLNEHINSRILKK